MFLACQSFNKISGKVLISTEANVNPVALKPAFFPPLLCAIRARKRSLDTPANLVLYRLIFPVSIPAEGDFERVTWLHAIGRSLCRRPVLRTRQVQII